jgi:hypothetical protein
MDTQSMASVTALLLRGALPGRPSLFVEWITFGPGARRNSDGIDGTLAGTKSMYPRAHFGYVGSRHSPFVQKTIDGTHPLPAEKLH